MLQETVSLFRFRIEFIYPFDGDYQKTIVYRFKHFGELVCFAFDHLKMLDNSNYVVYHLDTVLESHTPSSFVDGLKQVDDYDTRTKKQ